MGREVVVGQRFPIRKRQQRRLAAGIEIDFRPHPHRVLGVGRDVQHETLPLQRQLGHGEAGGAAMQRLPVGDGPGRRRGARV